MTDREKLIDIKNQIVDHLNEDEIEEPIKDEETKDEVPETEEPVAEEEDNVLLPPISDFKAVKISPIMVKCTWKANQPGTMDIEYYRPTFDKEWKHSVAKYVAPINIQDQSVIIGFNAEFGVAHFRAVVDGWISQIATSVKPKPEPIIEESDVIEPEPIVDEAEPVEEEELEAPVENDTNIPKGNVEVAFVFHDLLELDVLVNGGLLPKERPFDYTFDKPDGTRAGVKVVKTSTLKTVELNPDQIRVEGLNNGGFGAFCYKMITRNPEVLDSNGKLKYPGTDLSKINGNHAVPPDPDFWGQAGSINAQGVIISRAGDTTARPVQYPDPLFYMGWRDDPVNHPNRRIFHDIWSQNRKIVINYFNYGKPADNPVV